MTMPNKTWPSLWRGTLAPRLKAHWRWYDAGRSGEGRIDMKDENLQGASVRGLEGARFERCDLSGAVIALMDDAELVDCVFDEAQLSMGSWERTCVTHSRFHGAWIGATDFADAVIEGSDFLGAYLEQCTWSNVRAADVSFRAAKLVDNRFDNATFVRCDFRHADLSRIDPMSDFARCPGTRFEQCDFTGANFNGLRLAGAIFDRCSFYGVTGKPDLTGTCTLIGPDFSRTGYGIDSDSGIPALRDPDEVLRVWRDYDPVRIHHWNRYADKVAYEPERHYPERSGSR